MCSVQTEPSCIFTAAADGSVRMWDAARGALVHKTQLNSQPFVCADSSPVSIQAKERASRNGSTVVIVIVIFMT